MTALPFVIFGLAASGLYMQLLGWGVGPLVSFLIVSCGAAGTTLATLVVVEALDNRHVRARGRLRVVGPDERPALDRPRATVLDVRRDAAGHPLGQGRPWAALEQGELGPGGGDAA
ncbi:hypothetical protein BH20ACT9_BH20ACT9_06110 [soil metagenome]